MSLFDYYRPAQSHSCPVCGHPLSEWQGKDVANGLFLWAEGFAHPIDQLVDAALQIEPERRKEVTLPERFVIYSYDCPDHQPIEADCYTVDGIWRTTVLRPYTDRSEELRRLRRSLGR